MTHRLHVDLPLREGLAAALPDGAARHAQVLRVQPGDALVLFDGRGGEWAATVTRMGRGSVEVLVGAQALVSRELPFAVTLAVGMPANDRMDTLVEKAAELGVATIQPLVCERSVLRLAGERAERRRAHWEGVAVAACEQCGRTAVPSVAPVRALREWLAGLPAGGTAQRVVLSLREAVPLVPALASPADVIALSGPEGGLAEAEEDAARAAGFRAVTLGTRTLRADTAPLALLAHLSIAWPMPR